MHAVLLYCGMFLGSVLLGGISAAVVLGIAWAADRFINASSRNTVGLATAIGIALFLVGMICRIPWLAATSVLLFGWINLLVIALPVVICCGLAKGTYSTVSRWVIRRTQTEAKP